MIEFDEVVGATNHTGADVALHVYSDGDGGRIIGVFINRSIGETREQLLVEEGVTARFARNWRQTAERKLRDMHPNHITPQRLVPSRLTLTTRPSTSGTSRHCVSPTTSKGR